MTVSRRAILKTGFSMAALTFGGLAPASAMLPTPPRHLPSPYRAPGPLPAVLRSRQELLSRGVRFPGPAVAPTTLPIQPGGATYSMAQSLAWLDSDHFAVGRWDGSMNIFSFTASNSTGPLITRSVTTPSYQGVRMVVPTTNRSLASTNDDRSLVLWHSPSGKWSDLRRAGTFGYDSALGVATGGRTISQSDHKTLVIGHTSGHLSLWSVKPESRGLKFLRSVDIRNPQPVNPWGLHDVHAIEIVTGPDGVQRAVTGSEDGYVCVVEIPSGRILSQTVFNPTAQRGINDIGVRDDALLVANCSVGPDDRNLWYYTIDRKTWQITLRDSVNLIADRRRPQVFNFNTVWGSSSRGPCWFASTEEGALWMGGADGTLSVVGYQTVTSPLGSALGWTDKPGRLALVSHDLYEFVT